MTIEDLVTSLTLRVGEERNLDVSPSDVGWICAAFIRGISEAGSPGEYPFLESQLEKIATACESVQNES